MPQAGDHFVGGRHDPFGGGAGRRFADVGDEVGQCDVDLMPNGRHDRNGG
jgi:hypothetical protein